MQNKKIGFIGQGFVGKNYADNFEKRGYKVVRYAIEKPYIANKEKIQECDIVFIAVPTPTTPNGVDISIVESALSLVGTGKIAVIKSTIVPGTTVKLQEKYFNHTVFYSPEFLSETTAACDAANPFSNIVGVPINDEKNQVLAREVFEVLPNASYESICTSTEAELIKYSHNMSGYVQIILFNILYDTATHLGVSWGKIQEALEADPYISNRYARPVHKSGRGAGGHCFIKDFAAFANLYEKCVDDKEGIEALRSFEEKNRKLLIGSGKDVELLRGVYGNDIEERRK